MKKKCKKILSLLLSVVMLFSSAAMLTVSAAPSEEGKALSKEIAAEGVVLLKNEDNALPLSKEEKISVFGTTQLDAYLGGGGSGSIRTADAIQFLPALRTEGFDINEELVATYQKWWDEGGKNLDYRPVDGSGGALGEYTTSSVAHAEMPLTTEIVTKAKAVSDKAVVIIGRSGSEGLDLGIDDMALYPGEVEMLNMVTSKFDEVVVLLNICNAISLDFLNDYEQIKSAAIIWAPGEFGMEGVANVLSGDVNPSGKLADTFSQSILDHPSTVNFGDFVKPHDDSIDYADCELKYVQVSSWGGTSWQWKWIHADNCTYATCPADKYYVEYEEDIYVGYRYFETPEFHATDKVQFEFGYGLSYTTFEIENVDFSADANYITAKVKVTNTGDVAGKEVVQLYYSAPDGALEKPAKELGAFAKTDLLQPGESQLITIEFLTDEMTSYSEALEGYLLEDGTYTIYIGNSVRNVEVAGIYIQDEDKLIKEDPATGAEIKNLFPYLQSEDMTLLSKYDPEGTYPEKPPVGEKTVASSGWGPTGANENGTGNTGGRFAETGGLPRLVNNSIVMQDGEDYAEIQLKDVYENPYLMDDFIDQFTIEELVMMQLNGGFKTIGIERLGVPSTKSADGPACVNGSNNTGNGTAFPISTMQACTWSAELSYDRGLVSGREGRSVGTHSWYAPGGNTHRSPMAGRNFEYFSEDPMLGGYLMAMTCKGAQEEGLTTMIKHFAANDQEVNRLGMETYMTERAFREIYLKMFETSIRAGASGVMSAFNRLGTTWCGTSKELLVDLIRTEWGFEGFVVTDMWVGGYMIAPDAVLAGNDTMLSGGGNGPADFSAAYEADPEGITTALKAAAKNICNYVMTTYAFSDVIGSTENIGSEIRGELPFTTYYETAKIISSPSQAYVNEDFTIEVALSRDYTAIKLVNENGRAIGINNLEITRDGDTNIWKLAASVGTVGEGRTFTILARKAGGTYMDLGLSVTFDVVYAPVTTGIKAEVFSAEFSRSAIAKNTPVQVTLITNSVSKSIRATNEYGRTLGKSLVAKRTVPSGIEWIYETSIGTAGNRVFSFAAARSDGVYTNLVALATIKVI